MQVYIVHFDTAYVETRLKELKDEDKKADGKIGED